MEHDADTPTPFEEWSVDNLAYLEEQIQETLENNSLGETQGESLRAIGARYAAEWYGNLAEWYTDQLNRVQAVLNDRGISAYITLRGVQIRRTGFTVIEGEAS